MLPTGDGVIEIRDSITHGEREILPGDGERCLGYGDSLRNRGGGKGGGVFRSGGGQGNRSTPTNDGTGAVDLDDVTIAGGIV